MALAASEKSNGKRIRWNGIINHNHLTRHHASSFPMPRTGDNTDKPVLSKCILEMLALEGEIMRLLKCEDDNHRLGPTRFGPRFIKRSLTNRLSAAACEGNSRLRQT
jgi:hypothetical protein